MEFIAIDVETANADRSSICQIGLVVFNDSKIEKKWKTLVDPEDFFDIMNISIHGIDEETIKGAPSFPKIYNVLKEFIAGKTVVCHTSFDRVAITRAIENYDLEKIQCEWLDSARVARRAWSQFSQRGFGLKNLANHLGINYTQHDAEEDARAAGLVFIKAMEETGLDIESWKRRVDQSSLSIKRDGNPQGFLFGMELCFTGALIITRDHAADLAASVGLKISPSVKKSTNILVVGEQDLYKLAGHEKSSKHRKAEALLKNGADIQIITEEDFFELIKENREEAA